jgi:uncharacterized protein
MKVPSVVPHAVDLALIAVLVLLGVPELLLMPVLKRALAAGSTAARPVFYGIILAFEWFLAGAIIWLWLAFGRGWSGLFLGPVAPWRLGAGLALALLAGSLLSVYNRRAIEGLDPQGRAKLLKRVAAIEFFLPHTATECRIFKALSITAGICEEIIYRGFVMWVAASYVGLLAAVLLQSVIFGLGHMYQGDSPVSMGRAALKTGIAGFIFGLIAIAAGSLIPGMILHALTDLSTGDVAYRFFQKSEAKPALSY